uniref:Uncharacterized protein n=1 Tax=Chromera velia CCMP2878 TaxID=1169474 RepID=A0A0G4GMN3_9ALVE|eukprot:Cvel_22571.t1-p1 / transcript=Cvel_22571.t1 / gene=Cvel_22571 / organism=Chromera_velia_CCMP2878 / gene_product=hypothetical protein / transcript_product=hypothetical protein / location=Cvel_scaffold2230:22317-24078(-) / protein_length=166 / sequence_SO=supercontig / SO=protein_coding / is_pseudo=false
MKAVPSIALFLLLVLFLRRRSSHSRPFLQVPPSTVNAEAEEDEWTDLEDADWEVVNIEGQGEGEGDAEWVVVDAVGEGEAEGEVDGEGEADGAAPPTLVVVPRPRPRSVPPNFAPPPSLPPPPPLPQRLNKHNRADDLQNTGNAAATAAAVVASVMPYPPLIFNHN